MKSFNTTVKNTLLAAALVVGSANLTGCGYNAMQAQDEQINASWSEVVNQYQRRADLIPNLVKVVERYAQHEQATLTQVTQARSQATAINVNADVLNDPAAFQRYQQAQDQLGSALSRLMAVSERYPDLKADKQFQELQAQLEGTENRIAVARGRYIQAVQTYNTTVRQFPTNITAKVFGCIPVQTLPWLTRRKFPLHQLLILAITIPIPAMRVVSRCKTVVTLPMPVVSL